MTITTIMPMSMKHDTTKLNSAKQNKIEQKIREQNKPKQD